MRWLLAILMGWLGLSLAGAGELGQAQGRSIRSRSGQFVVRGLAEGRGGGRSVAGTGAVERLRLDPALLVVGCEEIKEALLRELGLRDQWRGSVQINLVPVRTAEQPIRIISICHPDGWRYEIEAPEQVDKRRFLKVMVEVVLREIAHREAGARQGELPPWLVDGLVVHLQATTLADLALEPGGRMLRAETRQEVMRAVRERLKRDRPLTLEELNWPSAKHLAGEGAAAYRTCAFLLVSELLQLKGGRQSLVAMLSLLPQYLNWQTGFLRAFHEQFPAMVDFDKWWGLTVVHFTGQDAFNLWPTETTLARLQEIMTVPVKVRLQADQLPVAMRAKVQSVLAEWDYAQQRPLLVEKINHLQALRWRAPGECGVLVDEYCQVLQEYVRRNDVGATQPPTVAALVNNAKLILQETVERLDQLDAQRLALGQSPGPNP